MLSHQTILDPQQRSPLKQQQGLSVVGGDAATNEEEEMMLGMDMEEDNLQHGHHYAARLLELPDPMPSAGGQHQATHLYPTALYPPTPVYNIWEDPLYALPPLPTSSSSASATTNASSSNNSHILPSQSAAVAAAAAAMNAAAITAAMNAAAFYGKMVKSRCGTVTPPPPIFLCTPPPNLSQSVPNGGYFPGGTPNFRSTNGNAVGGSNNNISTTTSSSSRSKKTSGSADNSTSSSPMPSSGKSNHIQLKDGLVQATYSNIIVFELLVNGVGVMRRQGDGWINATHILKVAGVEKGRRTKILEREMKDAPHEKIQGGYGKYQGTW